VQQNTGREERMGEDREFDREALTALEKIARDTMDLHLLLGEFVTSSRERIKGIHQAASADEVRRLAHPMKSGAKTIGAAGFSMLCRGIEQAGSAGELDEALRLAAELEPDFARVLAWLEQETGFSEP